MNFEKISILPSVNFYFVRTKYILCVTGNSTMYPFRWGNNCCDGTNQRNQKVLTENIFNIYI